jgi:hypothetical protein
MVGLSSIHTWKLSSTVTTATCGHSIIPMLTHEWGHQVRCSMNVWAGIIGNCVAGSYLLPDRLNGPAYCVFLQEVLPALLDDVPLTVRRDMWFQHDGAPAHFSAQIQQHLNTQFPYRWLGRGGRVSWPTRSPDLNLLDFFLWGHLKEIVCRANWHGRLDSKVSCCCGDHWCRHLMTCAS